MHGLSVPVGKLGYQLSIHRTLSSAIVSRSEPEPGVDQGRSQIRRPLGSLNDLTRLQRPKGEEPPRMIFPIGGSIIRSPAPEMDNAQAKGTETEEEKPGFSRISVAV